MPFNRKTKKVELSPKLKLGVGRGPSSINILKITGTLFLVAALALTVSTFNFILKASHSPTSQNHPAVLGASDGAAPANQSSEQNFVTYTIQKGDTVFSIAEKNGKIPWSTIATLNNLTPPFTLHVGSTLKLPKQ